MKLLHYLILMFVLILSSCVKSEICSTFYGEVVVTPDHVWDGVEVIMKIVPLDLGNGVSVSSESTINGKNVIRSITYYLDGEEIASSSDANADYAAKIIVSAKFYMCQHHLLYTNDQQFLELGVPLEREQNF